MVLRFQARRAPVERLGLSTSHFKGQGWSKGSSKRPDEVATALLPLLRKGTRPVAYLRDRLIASGLKQAKCEECDLTEWRGKPPPLQVEHIDGDHLNNEIANLKILCANCHMQTETWGFKGARRRPGQALVA
jgi:5-methylcytosine-specific restriction endonuclease McrA